MRFCPTLQKLFISAKFVTLSCHVVLFLIILMLLLYSSFLSFSAKLAMSSYRLQGHEGRSVQFKLSLVSVNFNASCELHRPAFMTLEPIRWQLRSWELMSILNRWLCKLSGKQMSNMADILFEKSLSKNENGKHDCSSKLMWVIFEDNS